MTNEPTNSDDIIDSRDIIARIEELQELRQPGPVELSNPEDNEAAQDDLFAELAALEALAKEGEAYAPDWEYGATLIRHSYFVDYTEELCKDIGDALADLPGYLAIDWDATAENIKVDYTEIDFDGVAYLVR